MKKRTLRKDLLIMTAIIPLVILGAVLYRFTVLKYFGKYVYCIASEVIGYYCPGCGGTRSVYALLQGDFLHSLWYHPVVPYTAVLYMGYLITNWLEWLGFRWIKGWKFHNWYIYLGLILLTVNFVIKNILRLKYGILME